MNIFFTSDYHFNHFNIIKYAHRPFKTVDEMNEAIIVRHNARVKDGDMVFDLGDFNFKNSVGGKSGEGLPVKPDVFLKRLNGTRIPIKGNHSKNNGYKTPISKVYLEFGGMNICLVHKPGNADPKADLNICGHVHTSWKVKRLNSKSTIVNVGVDVWNFYPVTFDDIMKAVAEFKRTEKNGLEQVTNSSEETTRADQNDKGTEAEALGPSEMGAEALE